MKIKARLLAVALALIAAFPTFAGSSPIPAPLRAGVVADDVTIAEAKALTDQGWAYVMPRPKSPQAAWGNRDGRTTWWVGYWTNAKTRATSSKQPVKGKDGIFVGDGLGVPSWRRGGSPPPPSKIEWLCSKDGGIAPR